MTDQTCVPAEEHTPGPWVARISSANYWDIETKEGPYRGTVATCHSAEHIRGITKREAEINARLIASLPDLLVEVTTLRARVAALEAVQKSAKTLTTKLETIHQDSRYEAVWKIAAIHGSPYSGPTYENELAGLRAALALAAPVGAEGGK